MKKSIRNLCTLAVLAAAAGASHANSYYIGTMRPYYVSNVLYIEETAVNKGAVPACVNTTRNLLRLSVDPASNEFKEQYAMLLAAWYTGRAINVAGTGVCTNEGDETVLTLSPQ